MKSILFLSTVDRAEFKQSCRTALFREGYEVFTLPFADQGVLTAIQLHAPELVLMPIGLAK